MSKVFLVDGSSVFFRAYHAIQNLNRSDGMATNAIYGYISTLHNLIKEFDPQSIIVAHDTKEDTFRSQIDVNYKSNREAPPDDLVEQIPYIKRVTDAMGIRQIEQDGYEADDLIGVMSVWLTSKNCDVMLVSSDKDLLQLVNGRVSMYRLAPMNKSKVYTEKEVHERYGVPPNQLVDVFALMGDSIDNVPGVPGIGEKTAIALIQEYGTLENLYEHVQDIKGKKRQENLITFKDQAFMSKQLVTIKTDLELDLDDAYFERQDPDTEKLLALYQDLEFRRFADELSVGPSKNNSPQVNHDYVIIDEIDQLDEIIEIVRQKKFCALDTESSSLETMQASLVGLSVSVEPNQGWYIPVSHVNGRNIVWEQAKPKLKQVLESNEIKKVGHNIKFDYHILANEDIFLDGIQDDTLIASYLVQLDTPSHKLDDLAFGLLNFQLTPIQDLIGSGKSQLCMAEIDIEKVGPYACEDTDATYQLYQVLIPKIENGLLDLYRTVEMPLLEVLAKMERKGITVDPDILDEQSNALGAEIKVLEEKIFDSVGKHFNLNSPLQLSQILYDDLKLLTGRKRSTRAEILEKLAEDGVEIARQILDYRHRQKIKSTYLDALRKLIHPGTNRVHTTYNQAVANTGRISSSDPNLQNIPTRTDLGRRVRRAFVAADGYRLISLDYSQIELRILAHISKDPGLVKAFLANEDIHSRTAAEIFEIDINSVTSDMRRKAKEINFGLNYGMSPYGLARRLGISDQEASQYIETYFKRYPNVQQYMDETVTYAQDHHYVETILKRRIPTRGINDRNKMRKDNARRAAINAPIQGSAADLLKVAMVKIDQELNPEHAGVLLTVHDELVIEVAESKVNDVKALCQDIMENAFKLDVPTPVEYAVGSHWAELK